MNNISGTRARALVSKGAVLVDLRSPVEFRDYAIPGSINLSLRNLTSLRLHPTKTPIILVGDAPTTTVAYNYIEGFGFTNIHTLGDVSKWTVVK